MVGSGTTKIKPGIMVALSARMNGGVTYRRKDIEKSIDGSGTAHAKWETEKTVIDAAEHDAASKVRSAARYEVSKTCANTGFGLLCPLENESLLDAAIATAKKMAADFNATSKYSKIELYVLKGRIAATDKEAADAIASEMRSLLDEMESALKSANVEAIRDAATKAGNIGTMLADDGGGDEVGEAIKAARKVARQIVKRVEKGGEDAQAVLAEIGAEGTAAINTARFALLSGVGEVDGSAEVVADEDVLPSVDASRFTDIEVGDDSSEEEELPPEAGSVEGAPVVEQGTVEVVEDAPVVEPVTVARAVVLDIPVSPSTPLGMTCPKCGKGLIIKGRGAWGCNRYKVCQFTVSFKNQDGTDRSLADIVSLIEAAPKGAAA